jgi:hypothetical protein
MAETPKCDKCGAVMKRMGEDIDLIWPLQDKFGNRYSAHGFSCHNGHTGHIQFVRLEQEAA